MTSQAAIRSMNDSDPPVLSAAFTAIGWHKPTTLFERYLMEQDEGLRLAFVAERNGKFAGYVTLVWGSGYAPFAEGNIPEVSDLNVLPNHRSHGVGNRLLDSAEAAAATRSSVVGLGVGLHADYGAAQRVYVRRGYLPDGRGIVYDSQPVEPGSAIRVDDSAMLMFTRRLGDLTLPRRASD